MPSVESLAVIESEGHRLLGFARQDRSAPVPQYPGWTLADLLSHTASIHARTIVICRELPQERVAAPQMPEGNDPLDWYASTLDTMLATLADTDHAGPVWTFGTDKTLAFWLRRMVVETGVHRWDGQQAIEEPDPLVDEVARAGLEEFPEMWLPRLPPLPSLRVTATDLGETWIYGDGLPEGHARGTASDLFLRLMARPGAELPRDWADAVDSLGTPQRT